nr:hypothetical protein Iba_scaffold16324CG0050 [Ipomoea batatas]
MKIVCMFQIKDKILLFFILWVLELTSSQNAGCIGYLLTTWERPRQRVRNYEEGLREYFDYSEVNLNGQSNKYITNNHRMQTSPGHVSYLWYFIN